MCRMYAVNCAVGRCEYDVATFALLLERFKKEFPELPDPADFDSMHSDQETVVSMALREHLHTTTHLVAGASGESLFLALDHGAGVFMVLTHDHIYTVRRDPYPGANGQHTWWNLDSNLRCPQEVNLGVLLPSLEKRADVHVLCVWTRRRALLQLNVIHADLVRILHRFPSIDPKQVFELDLLRIVTDDINNKKLIERFEILLVQFMRYYMFCYATTPETHVATDMFSTWFAEFKRPPGNMDNILRFFPSLLHWVLQYSEFTRPDPPPPRARKVRTIVDDNGTKRTFVL